MKNTFDAAEQIQASGQYLDKFFDSNGFLESEPLTARNRILERLDQFFK
jgi:hypothetical protein